MLNITNWRNTNQNHNKALFHKSIKIITVGRRQKGGREGGREKRVLMRSWEMEVSVLLGKVRNSETPVGKFQREVPENSQHSYQVISSHVEILLEASLLNSWQQGYKEMDVCTPCFPYHASPQPGGRGHTTLSRQQGRYAKCGAGNKGDAIQLQKKNAVTCHSRC